MTDPMPEAKSGTEYKLGHNLGVAIQRRRGDLWVAQAVVIPGSDCWKGSIPSGDHDHVAALLKREGVE